jgi:hypothetical protein
MRPGQGETGQAVVCELRWTPTHGGMANGAICAEITRDVIRIGSGLIRRLMTRITDCAGLVVISAGRMADAATADIMAPG